MLTVGFVILISAVLVALFVGYVIWAAGKIDL